MYITQKQYSIQSGGPDKGGSLGRELKARLARGGIVGGAIGGMVGILPAIEIGAEEKSAKWGLGILGGVITTSAIIGSMADAFSALGANKRKAKLEGTTMDNLLDYLTNQMASYIKDTGSEATEINVQRYILEDKDPRNFMVNFAFEDKKLIIYLNKPTGKLIDNINDNLEHMIKFNRKSDYAAYPTKDGFMVFVEVPDIDEAAGLIYNIIVENGIKVNALTNRSFDNIKIKK